ncbi:holin [Bacteroidia bacterium]|nr:holin [Bacteroidia bacterium]
MLWEDVWTGVKVGVAGVGAALAYVYGPLDSLIVVLLCLVALDYITGVACAWMRKTLNSEHGFRGLLKKAMILILVGVAALVDRAVPDLNGMLRAAVCAFYIANEGLSILENAGSLGLPLPRVLVSALEKLGEREK